MSKNSIIIVVLILVVSVGLIYLQPKDKEIINGTTETEQTQQTNQEIALEENQSQLNIDSTQSKASYEIDEVLNGKEVRVLGETQALSGYVILDKGNNQITNAEIKLDATTFKTDIEKRDGNVIGLVLRSDQPENKFITFKLNNSIDLNQIQTPGQELPITIEGDLTISNVTKPATFTGTMKYLEGDYVEILAKTSIAYEEFGVYVPDFPFLSNVSKTTDLSVVLVAR